MSSVDPSRPTLIVGDQHGRKVRATSGAAEYLSPPSDLINLKEAARVAGGVHPTTVRRWIFRRMLKAYRRPPSGVLYVSRAEVVALVQPVESDGAE